MDEEFTTIKVPKKLIEKLNTVKLVKGEFHYDAIDRLIEAYKGNYKNKMDYMNGEYPEETLKVQE